MFATPRGARGTLHHALTLEWARLPEFCEEFGGTP